MSKIIKDIVNDVIRGFINEGVKFKQGEVITIPTDPSVARKILRIKYGANPDDFEYAGGGRWIYKLKSSNGVARKKAQPKRKREYLGRKEDETEQEYLERVRELNKNYAEVEKEIPGEGWRPITNKGRYFGGNPDYSKSYEVSNMGRIRIIDFEDPMRSRISTGYDAPGRSARNFHLNIPGFKTTPPIHTLVADAWLPEPEGGVENYDVEHIDGNYQNNRADNLRYVPKKGRRGRRSKVDNVVAESFRRIVDKSVKTALNEMDLSFNQIRNITGITDDDEINSACMAEDADKLGSDIIKDLREEYGFHNIYEKNVVLDFNFVKDLLESKYGLKYLGYDQKTEAQTFGNDKYLVELWSKEGYPKLAKFHLFNFNIHSTGNAQLQENQFHRAYKASKRLDTVGNNGTYSDSDVFEELSILKKKLKQAEERAKTGQYDEGEARNYLSGAIRGLQAFIDSNFDKSV